MKRQKTSCLFIGDKNLGFQGAGILSDYFPALTIRIWDREDLDARRHIRREIGSRRWPLVFSFYSDFIFTDEDLCHIDLPLNIHPARPEVPGLGYDVVPILEAHALYGSTLHWMDEKIDSGEIFDVIELPLPEHCTSTQLRKLNQLTSLALLHKWAPRLASVDELDDRLKLLRTAGHAGRKWSGEFMTRKQMEMAKVILKLSQENSRPKIGGAEKLIFEQYPS